MRVWLLVVVLAVPALLAGCTKPEDRPVDFGGVEQTQMDVERPFELTVKVVGVGNDTKPLAGAFVGAAYDGQALARATTDANGQARLVLARGQRFTIVSQADGWTTEESHELRVGAIEEAVACALTLGLGCVVAASDEEASTFVAGERAEITMLLFRANVQQRLEVAVGPHVRTPVSVLPDNKYWFAATQPIHDEGDLARLYMLRLVATDAKLSWTNDALNQADLELGVACDADAPAERTQGDEMPNRLATQGPVSVGLQWNPDRADAWSTCRGIYAGPIVDAGNSETATTVEIDLSFEGNSSIVPVNV